MAYHIESIEVFVRETPPARMSFALGKQPEGQPLKPTAKRRPRGIFLCRMIIANDRGERAWGAAGDRPSFGWLDKRKAYTNEQKYERLRELVLTGRKVWLENATFSSPFSQWHRCHALIQKAGRDTDHESLSSSYTSALFERAMIDAVCRLHQRPVFDMIRDERLGIEPGRIHPELAGTRLGRLLSTRPRTRFHVRHTVGLADPILAADQPPAQRINDGEPETLEEYIARDGLRYFKVKIAGDPAADLERLERVWAAVSRADEAVVTLDGNESADDIDAFARFVENFERRLPGLFQHTAFIEQPLTRALTHDRGTAGTIKAISRKKRLIIDEADGNTNAFRHAFDIGYAGVSHKNCKGFLKSLLNLALCHQLGESTGREAFQTGEDLSLMPLVPIQQDYAALGVLNIAHAERNGHHYAYGEGHLTKDEKALALRHHPDLYVRRNGEMFLNIRDGMIRCESLQGPGFGVRFAPDWDSLTPLEKWPVVW